MGGISSERAPTVEDIILANLHKQEAEARLARTFTRFDIVAVQTQVVAGIKTFFRIIVDGQLDQIHMGVFTRLGCNGGGSELTSAYLIPVNKE
jgi:hypothetical protein